MLKQLQQSPKKDTCQYLNNITTNANCKTTSSTGNKFIRSFIFFEMWSSKSTTEAETVPERVHRQFADEMTHFAVVGAAEAVITRRKDLIPFSCTFSFWLQALSQRLVIVIEYQVVPKSIKHQRRDGKADQTVVTINKKPPTLLNLKPSCGGNILILNNHFVYRALTNIQMHRRPHNQ